MTADDEVLFLKRSQHHMNGNRKVIHAQLSRTASVRSADEQISLGAIKQLQSASDAVSVTSVNTRSGKVEFTLPDTGPADADPGV